MGIRVCILNFGICISHSWFLKEEAHTRLRSARVKSHCYATQKKKKTSVERKHKTEGILKGAK